jgi:hypothetical protein
MGFNNEADVAYYANGLPQANRFPGANIAGQGGSGFTELHTVDPATLLQSSDSNEDGTQPVDDSDYAYYPEGEMSERDLNYSSGSGVPVGEQNLSCPWWTTMGACQ